MEEEEEEEPIQAKAKPGKTPVVTPSLASEITPLVQRQPIEEEEEEVIQKQREEEEKQVQTKETSRSSPELAPSVENGIKSIRGGGQPLTESSRAFFEPRFGKDFSSIRVHTDPRASDLSKSTNAKAFTLGRDVVFGAGQYAPESTEGKRLIAHELTHVAQQEKSNKVLQRKPIQPKEEENIAAKLTADAWILQPEYRKVLLVDVMLYVISQNLDKFPGKIVFGDAWIFLKEGLAGFFERLISAKKRVKLIAMDKIAKIMSGQSFEYTKGLLIGLLKGFFLDGLFGIFMLIWDLLKGLTNLWSFFVAVGKLIGRFPAAMEKTIDGFKSFGKELSDNIKPAIEELNAFISDPSKSKELIEMMVEHGKSYAKEAGQGIADSLLKFFTKPGAEEQIGTVVGRGIGMVMFEIIFGIITSGGGAVVSGMKTAAKLLAKIGGKIIGSVLKVLKEIGKLFDFVIDIIKGAAKFVKGKMLGKLSGKLGKLLKRVKKFINRILKNCHESKIRCTFPRGRLAGKAAFKAVSKTLKRLKRFGYEITGHFHKRLLERAPNLKAIQIDNQIKNGVRYLDQAEGTILIMGRKYGIFVDPKNVKRLVTLEPASWLNLSDTARYVLLRK